ncbi:MAG: SGNH/GDSL hydrolase family protein [Gemmatimonadaceae bacterium]
MTASGFTRYVALGDSVSMDLYPALDAGETDVAVALERDPAAGRVAPLGAASLLFQNVDDRWPDDAGNDLSSRYRKLAYANYASDGATIGEVFGEQLTHIEESAEPALVTLTIGGNDLLSAFGSRPRLLERIGADIAEAYDLLVDSIRRCYSNGTLILTTVYDPSDRTGKVPGVYDDRGALPLEMLDRLNEHIRTLARGTPKVLLADVYARFLGHGVSAADADRWYWPRSLVEPNARGANEIRHVWLDALASAEQT